MNSENQLPDLSTAKNIHELAGSLPEEFDLTDTRHHEFVREMADMILQSGSVDSLPESKNIFLQLACRMAKAKSQLLGQSKSLNVVAIMNLLGEHNRLRPKSEENPYGEDSLLRKLEEVQWLANDLPNITIDLLYVSGGDWWNSEEILQERINSVKSSFPDIRVDLIKTRDYPEWEGRNTNDKGGEWNLGLRLMTADKLSKRYDAAYLTDADTTFNLAASLGESIAYHLNKGWDVILGNRKDPDSVVQKNAKRTGPGAGWQYLITRYIARIFYEQKVLDTQCPSRFYSLNAAKIIDKKASLDTWTVESDHNFALMSDGFELHFVPVVAVDSEKESVGLRMPPDDPNPAYRISKIINGQVEIVKKYAGDPELNLPHVDQSLEMADIVNKEIYSYDEDKPWLGLSKLFNYDDENYRTWPLADFNPDKISLDEFRTIIKKALR